MSIENSLRDAKSIRIVKMNYWSLSEALNACQCSRQMKRVMSSVPEEYLTQAKPIEHVMLGEGAETDGVFCAGCKKMWVSVNFGLGPQRSSKVRDS